MSSNNLPNPSSDTAIESSCEDSQMPSVLSILKQIHSGSTDPKTLNQSTRQQVIEHLMTEGYSLAEMAQILSVSERTVARDKKTIRQGNSVKRDPQMVEEVVGDLMREAEATISRIRRISRDTNVPPGVRVDAERNVWKIKRELVVQLQSLGYLPTATQKLQADLTHHIDETESLQALQTELQRLHDINQQHNSEDKVTTTELQLMQDNLSKFLLSSPNTEVNCLNDNTQGEISNVQPTQ